MKKISYLMAMAIVVLPGLHANGRMTPGTRPSASRRATSSSSPRRSGCSYGKSKKNNAYEIEKSWNTVGHYLPVLPYGDGTDIPRHLMEACRPLSQAPAFDR